MNQPASAGLTLVGVGPGDPDLLTLAAVAAIEAADLIACPVARSGAESMAARIARRWIRPHQAIRPLLFPMVPEEEPRQQAWNAAADVLAADVAQGQNVVLLCEGDASLFATGSYVLLALQWRHPSCPRKVVPGISAVSAAAAQAAWPLALQQDQLLILPCPDEAVALHGQLDQALTESRVLALLKLGHRWAWVRPLLAQRGLLTEALFAERVGWPDQILTSGEEVPGQARPYFSMLLIRQCWPALMP